MLPSCPAVARNRLSGMKAAAYSGVSCGKPAMKPPSPALHTAASPALAVTVTTI
jgi:hypothetical protein